jgi:hypothetical protein
MVTLPCNSLNKNQEKDQIRGRMILAKLSLQDFVGYVLVEDQHHENVPQTTSETFWNSLLLNDVHSTNKGSRCNMLVPREDGYWTYDPLNIIFRDDPVS